MASSGGTEKLERKTVEKNRRIHMKNLCSKLSSLIPVSKNTVTQKDQLDQAFDYIKELKERVDRLRELKEMRSRVMIGFRPAQVEVRNLDPNLEVILVCGSRTRFMFHEVISVLEEEGVEVINASFSTVGDRIFHSIHCQAISTRIGLDPSRIDQRLKQLVR
ncbi:unnamed protein product [Musa acuminata subsp. burmannicoides]